MLETEKGHDMNTNKAGKVEISPLPWKHQSKWVTSEGPTIADCSVSTILKEGEAEANAAFIVQCANERDALVAIAEAAKEFGFKACSLELDRPTREAMSKLSDALAAYAKLKANV